jgi:hypothetical protein
MRERRAPVLPGGRGREDISTVTGSEVDRDRSVAPDDPVESTDVAKTFPDDRAHRVSPCSRSSRDGLVHPPGVTVLYTSLFSTAAGSVERSGRPYSSAHAAGRRHGDHGGR